MNDLFRRCQAELPEAMKLWEDIVNIDSGSRYTAGLIRVAEVLEDKLARLGFAVTRHVAEGGGGEYNIVATREGTGSKSVLLMAHMDTVFPEGTVAQRPFTVKGDWVHGPGVADCKGGIVTILHAAKLLGPESYKRMTILFNCDEEITSPSSKAIVMDEAARHDFTFSFEPGDAGDKVVTGRKGNAKIKLSTYGKNSHAGSAPYAGVNALAEIVWQLNRMRDLGDRDKQTSVVFTTLSCGERINVVPDRGEAWADVRAAFPEELDRLESDLQRLTSEQLLPDSRVEVSLIRNRPPFPENAVTNGLIEKAKSIYGEIGKELGAHFVGGVGDVNFAYPSGSACLCKLAPHNGGPNHTADESCFVPSLHSRLYLAVRLIQDTCS